MPALSGLKVVVAGAGALGSALAWRLQAVGASVVLADPTAPGDNASGVAAGMLAPAFEAVLDPTSQGHFDLLREARDRWVNPPGGLRLSFDRCGAAWIGDRASLEDMQQRLEAIGARVRRLTPDAALRMTPGVRAAAGAVFTPEDWRVEPIGALKALRGAFQSAGGVCIADAVTRAEPGKAVLDSGQTLAADVVVLATGRVPAVMAEAVPEAALIRPIKGQIARAGSGPADGPIIRAEGVYIAPSAGGARIGATMEPGADDRQVDEAVLRELVLRAAKVLPGLADAPLSGAAGVRAGTSDGLPLVGPSRTPGLFLALAARRNGWLLCLEIAEAAAAWLERGQSARPLFDPSRFVL